MQHSDTRNNREPKLGRTLFEDLGRGDITSTLRRDLRELNEFMLTDERRRQLKEMRRIKRWFVWSWWLLKSLFLKLTPARRLLLFIAFVLMFLRVRADAGSGVTFLDGTFYPVSILIFIIILMLELKDKLLARGELEAGRAVQEALMPERSPEIPGWKVWLYTRSANEVGGDLVDFIRVNNNRAGVVLGDVAGKGLSAALLTAKLQASLRALLPDFASVDSLVSKLNQIFCRDSLPSLFASLVYAEIRSDTGEVSMANAGHFPPVVISGLSVRKLEKGGMAIGLSPTATYLPQHVALQSNDLLLIYSDGLTEAQNLAGEFFGEDRLMKLLTLYPSPSPSELGELLVRAVDHFVGEARRHDDVSIVLMKRM
jgi:sigma-B regulation protein RsbU (phosphoserine phosphatase)